jgi:hypothetical protein
MPYPASPAEHWDSTVRTPRPPTAMAARLHNKMATNKWFFIDSTVNFHSLQQNPGFQLD